MEISKRSLYLLMALFLLLMIIIGVNLTYASEWSPYGNVNLRGIYYIYNATYVNATDFYGNINASYVENPPWISSVNESELNVNHSVYSDYATSWDSETSQADLNVNDSDYLDGYDSTEFILASSEGDLNVNSSTYWDDETNQSNLNVNGSNYWDTYNVPTDLNYKLLLYWENITSRWLYLSNFTDDLGSRGYTALSNFTDDLGDRGYDSLSNFTDDLGDRGYTALSNFTDDLGDRDYDSLSNFTNDIDLINSTYANSTYILQSEEGNLNVNDSDYLDGYDSTEFILSTDESSLSVNYSQYANLSNLQDLNDSAEIVSVNDSLQEVITDYANLTQDESVTGNWVFTPTSNITFSSGDVLFYSPVYFFSNVTLTNASQMSVNGSIILQDVAGATIGNWTDNSGSSILWNDGIINNTGQIISTLAIGTSPFSIVSTTLVEYLNADLLDGYNATSFILSSDEGDLNVNYSTTSGTATTWDGETSQANLNVNNSDYLETHNAAYFTDYTDSKLITTFYNASAISVVTGTGAGTIGLLQIYDSISYNVSEVSSDLDFRVNFTGITEFNQLVLRYKSAATETHTMSVSIWDYDSSAWENYLTVGQSPDYNVFTLGVYDYAEHISGGVVQVRFYSNNGAPFTTHKHQFDWVTISKGPATPSSAETDPYSIHIDGLIPLTANWNAGAFNITASWFNGNVKSTIVNTTNLYATNLEKNIDATGYGISASTELASITGDFDNLEATNLESNVDATGFNITVKCIIGAAGGMTCYD